MEILISQKFVYSFVVEMFFMYFVLQYKLDLEVYNRAIQYKKEEASDNYLKEFHDEIFSSYRPISLLSVISRMFEKNILYRIEIYNKLCKLQQREKFIHWCCIC